MRRLQRDLTLAGSKTLQLFGRFVLHFAGPFQRVSAEWAGPEIYEGGALPMGVIEWRIAPPVNVLRVEIEVDGIVRSQGPVRGGMARGFMASGQAPEFRLLMFGGDTSPSPPTYLSVRRLNWRSLLAHLLNLPGSRRAIAMRWFRKGRQAAEEALMSANVGATIEEYEEWLAEFETPQQSTPSINAWLATQTNAPLISVVTAVYETSLPFLNACLESVKNQAYQNWEHCLVDDCSPNDSIIDHLKNAAASDPRLRCMRRQSNGGIAASTNDGIAMARGDWIAFLDHDDALSVDALALAAAAIIENPNARIIYTDEDKIDDDGIRSEPYLKGGWNPSLFATQNYLNHLTLIRRDLIAEAGGLSSRFDGSQDYELLLRCIRRVEPNQIIHIPAIAYHWRFARSARNYSLRQAEKTQETMRSAFAQNEMRGARLESKPDRAPYPWLRPAVPNPIPLVSIVIPTRDGAALLGRCVKTLKERAGWSNLEFIVMDNESRAADALELLELLRQDGAARVARFSGPFNFSAINNAGAKLARGEILAFVNNDIEARDDNWLLEMVRWFSDPTIAAVGAKLLYPDGRIQHAGLVTGIGGGAGHLYKYREGSDPGPFGNLARARDVSSLTAACLLVRADAFEAIKGFDEAFPVAFNDVDLCLRLNAAGHRLVWTPDAVLIHHESATRGRDTSPERAKRLSAERDRLRARWGSQLDNDPYYNPNLTLADESGALARPPRYHRPWARNVI